MTVKIWTSYSCNNSSSFRLVARFNPPETAEAIATELRAQLLCRRCGGFDEVGPFP